MKNYFLIVVIIVGAFSCRPKQKSFDKVYFVAYNRPLHGLPDDFNGQPPISINRFVEIGRDGIVINGNRNSHEDSTVHFYKSRLSENFLDSINDLTIHYANDKSFLEQDQNGTFDSYYLLCLLIETRDRNVLIEFFDSHTIPDDLKPIVSEFWKLSQEKYTLETTSNQFLPIPKEIGWNLA